MADKVCEEIMAEIPKYVQRHISAHSIILMNLRKDEPKEI